MTQRKSEIRKENEAMDVLMDGPGSIRDISQEAEMNPETARRIVRNLVARGLVEEYGEVPNGQSRPVMQYQLARTKRKAA